MDFGFLVASLCVGALVSFFGWMIRYDCTGVGKVVATIISTLATIVLVVSLAWMGLYGIASEQVEYELFLPVSTVDGAQYVQWNDPDTGIPRSINVNHKFSRSFTKDDVVKVTIFVTGPYNGVYQRPVPRIELINMGKPPAPPSDAYIFNPHPC